MGIATISEPVAITSAVPPVTLRPLGDVAGTRSAIFGSVLKAAQELKPVSNKLHSLHLKDVEYIDPDTFSPDDEKQAILSRSTLGRRLRGTWELTDNATGEVLDSRKQVIASVPYMSNNGTFTINGSSIALRNQQRLMSGIYHRQQANGMTEAHVNTLPGQGVAHRYHLDPAKGAFYMAIGGAKLPLLPLLNAMGATKEQLRQTWGDDLYTTNSMTNEATALSKYQKHFLPNRKADDPVPLHQALREKFESMGLDPEVTEATLGYPHKSVNLDAILASTKKLLDISQGKAETDDRDSIFNQKFFGPEDFFAERVARDHGGLRRKLLWKMSAKRSLKGMPSSALKSQIETTLIGAQQGGKPSGLSQIVEGINPTEVLDRQFSITRMGEGGIGSSLAIPDESRDVSSSHLAFIDPVRTPESQRAGVDLYLTRNAQRGSDGRLYTQLNDYRTGQQVWRSPQDVRKSTIAFADELENGAKRVSAMRGGKHVFATRDQIDYLAPPLEDMFSPLANLVPIKSGIKNQRLAMGSRYITQALPLQRPEAPLVQSAVPGTNGQVSFEDHYAEHVGAVKAKRGGYVVGIEGGKIQMQNDDGTTGEIPLYVNYPNNRKTLINQTPVVTQGQRVNPGDLLARSNYTDDKGTMSIGLNARVAMISWGGKNFEDGIVISESVANRLRSEHMYQHDLDPDPQLKRSKRDYVSLFPSRYDRETLDKLDDNGVIRPGTEVKFGDPLIVAAREKDVAENKVHKRGQRGHTDVSVTWEHHDPGVVTDILDTEKGTTVLVKSFSSMQIGDKLSGRFGDKGVVSTIIPDHQMPHDAQGQPFEILLNPLGVVSRANPAQMIELWLGKVARARGQAVKFDDRGDEMNNLEQARQALSQAGLSDTETITDPETGREIPGIATGDRFFLKLHHQAESKLQSRSGGGYSSDETPSKGGPTGSKRVSGMDSNALLSHGSTEVLKDAVAVRGQRNEQLWLGIMQGHMPQVDKSPVTYDKFLHQLRGAGVHIHREGPRLHIMAMTNQDVDALAGDRDLTSGDTVKGDRTLKPIPGGLFDPAMTGGHAGKNWTAIPLAEPLPSPVMEDPVRRMLGLTKNKFEDILAGREEMPSGGTGPSAIGKALGEINIDREILNAKNAIAGGRKTARDDAVKKLRYLTSAKEKGITPADWMLKRVPVLPPAFRPISIMGCFHGRTLVWAEHGMLPIRKIVESDDPIRVWSYDFEAREFVLARVTNRFCYQTSDGHELGCCSFDPSPARMAVTSGVFRPTSLKVTATHQVYSPNGTKVNASDATVLLQVEEQLSGPQNQLLYGSLLGDAHVSAAGCLVLGHGWKQKEYLEWKHSILPLSLVPNGLHHCLVTSFKGLIDSYRVASRAHTAFYSARHLCYPGGKKTISQDWLDRVDELGLAFWYGDDGTLCYDGNIPLIKLGTYGYTRHGIDLLQAWLMDRWGCDTHTERFNSKYGSRDMGWVITMRNAAAHRFIGLVAPYMPPVLAYKCRGVAVECGQLCETVTESKVTYVLTEIPCRWRDEVELPGSTKVCTKWVYDLEVEGTHNYFANGTLVSNSTSTPLVSDSNFLYQELFDANKAWGSLQATLGDKHVGDERLLTYNAFKAVTGLGDPIGIKTKEKGVKGLLRGVFGSSPKFGSLQRRLISTTVDNVSRAVIVPNPALDMDHVGIPEDSAFGIYERFIARRMKRSGMPLTQALQQIRDKTPLAKKFLMEEMADRPVFINRAPVLHKLGIMAFWPQLAAGRAMEISPLIVKGFNADHDGDAMQIHVPALEGAKREAIERMMPSHSLLSQADFRSPVHTPANEYVAGLWFATKGAAQGREKKIFHDIQELKDAHARGQVNIDDPVQVLDHSSA